jgi:hypothetical protein
MFQIPTYKITDVFNSTNDINISRYGQQPELHPSVAKAGGLQSQGVKG